MGKAPDNRWRQKVDEMKVTEQERQMLEVLREWNDLGENYRLVIEHRDGAWELELTGSHPKRDAAKARGFGRTLSQAWDEMAPLGM
jgi:hypothetical protein